MHVIKKLSLEVANSSVLPILHVFSALVCAETPLQEQRLVSLMEKKPSGLLLKNLMVQVF